MSKLRYKIWLFFFKRFHKQEYIIINSMLDMIEKQSRGGKK